jgi:ABC-type Fe3+-hydroxamate transport system substrate-binding protein
MVLMLVLATAAVVGCTDEAERARRAEEIAAEKVQQALDAGRMDGDNAGEMVTVAVDGSELEPPVEIGQIPVGAWYCDMGTVHYARMTRGDGVCPRCGMSLSRQGSAASTLEP